ncbi:hypothetical protein [Marinicrinis lubricantis]|uniref:Uncharacterized protein n=1 Tax=Marinicrinis lubricantis TaxID=2086470 RepID=A0ABW1ISL5_9BACL
MNNLDAYVTYMSLIVLLILLATGWKKELFGEAASPLWIIISIFTWLLLSVMQLTLGDIVIELQLVVPWIWSLVLLKVRWKHTEQLIQLVVISLLIGCLLLLYQHVVRLEPKLIFMNLLLDRLILTVVTMLVFSRKRYVHFILLTWGLIAYEAASYALKASSEMTIMGGYSYFSIWMPGIILVSAAGAIVEQLRKWTVLLQHKFEKRE